METALPFALPAIAVYLVPSMIATVRGHDSALAIVVLNILLGWTFIGWVIALVWALSNPRKIIVVTRERDRGE